MDIVPQMEKPKSEGSRKVGSFFYGANLPFFVTLAVLVLFGLLVVGFVIKDSDEYTLSRQIVGITLGLAIMVVMWKLDYNMFSQMMVPLLVIDIILIMSPHLPIIGYSAGGATSWVKIGIRFQPGEIAKVVSILLMASMVARYHGRLDDPHEYVKCLAVMMVPFVCIMTQPDLGTGIVLLTIGMTVIFEGGADRRLLLITIGVLVGLVVVAIVADPILDSIAGTDVFLKEYQKNRLLVFLNEDLDPTGAGYNLKQAKIAIGSGGLFGKGLGNATQSALGFLPEAPTDFVFCTVAEQLGFVGVLALLALYAFLFHFTLQMARNTTSDFGRLIIMGVCGMWLFQILENIGMTCGLMPITGIPLPFISYGSSFMLVNFACVGLIMSVWSRERGSGRPKFE